MIQKNLTEEQKQNIVSKIDNEGFWYSLTIGGYLYPEDVLENQEDIDKVNKAIEILTEFEDICPKEG